jgi:hypothetical protein
MSDNNTPPESLLPYDAWMDEALRGTVLKAIDHVAAHGLPGGHHFYLSFRTGYPGVSMPERLRAQYPHEMTIVLQNQFWDLKVDHAARRFSVGLSFGGIPCTLVIPAAALSGFADPYVQLSMQLHSPDIAVSPKEADADADVIVPSGAGAPRDRGADATPAGEKAEEAPQVVSLDAFRRRTTQKD